MALTSKKLSQLNPLPGNLTAPFLIEVSQGTPFKSYKVTEAQLIDYIFAGNRVFTGDNFQFVNAAGSMGVNLISNNSFGQVVIESYRTSTSTHCNFVGNAAYESATTPGTPDFVGANNASLFELSSRPWNGSTFANLGRVAFLSTQVHSAGKIGVACVISATPRDSATRQDVLRISADDGLTLFGVNNIIVDTDRNFRNRSYTVATLPTPGVAGRAAYASNARAMTTSGAIEGAGAGTGALVTDNGSAWKLAGTNVTAVA